MHGQNMYSRNVHSKAQFLLKSESNLSRIHIWIVKSIETYELNAFKRVLEPWKDLVSDWNFPGFFQFPGKTHNSSEIPGM